VLKFIVDYLQYLAATLYHILEYLNSLPAFAAVISQLTLMSVLEHYILYTTITIYCKQNTFLFRSESCFCRLSARRTYCKCRILCLLCSIVRLITISSSQQLTRFAAERCHSSNC